MSHIYINQLKPGTTINDVYMVTQPVLRNTTRGDLYIAMFLSDKTGKVNCRMWNATEEFYESLPKEGFVHINGKVELYQNAMQIVINQAELIDPMQVNTAEFLPATTKDIPEMFAQVKEIVASIQHPYIKAIVDEYLGDKDLMDKFCRAPAAVKMHHAYLGGLLEHTLSMLKVANVVLPLYPNVQADLVIAGIFLHDLAKTEELSYHFGFSYTNTGQMLGHIVQSAIWLDQKADVLLEKGMPVNQDIIDNLTHILISHHGKHEFGSPKLPATLEAVMVSYIDDLDAKLNFATDAIDNEQSPDDWTSWNNLTISPGTKFYRRRVTEE